MISKSKSTYISNLNGRQYSYSNGGGIQYGVFCWAFGKLGNMLLLIIISSQVCQNVNNTYITRGECL